jgi:hypothetical protein
LASSSKPVQDSRAAAPEAATPAASTSYKPQDPHDEKLYEEIRACEDWKDMLEIIADEGAAMSTRRCVCVTSMPRHSQDASIRKAKRCMILSPYT